MCLGTEVGRWSFILAQPVRQRLCYNSLSTTLHWRNTRVWLLNSNTIDMTLFILSLAVRWIHVDGWWCLFILWRDPVFLQFSYFTITVSHHFANFQCHPLWQKRKYTILIFGIWHPTALLWKELFIIFHNRCIFIIATILLRFQKSVCLRFHKKCSARKKTRKTTICSSGCTIRVISFNQIFTSDSFKNLSLLFFTQAWND